MLRINVVNKSDGAESAQSINQSIDECRNWFSNQSINRSINSASKQWATHLINQSIDWWRAGIITWLNQCTGPNFRVFFPKCFFFPVLHEFQSTNHRDRSNWKFEETFAASSAVPSHRHQRCLPARFVLFHLECFFLFSGIRMTIIRTWFAAEIVRT